MDCEITGWKGDLSFADFPPPPNPFQTRMARINSETIPSSFIVYPARSPLCLDPPLTKRFTEGQERAGKEIKTKFILKWMERAVEASSNWKRGDEGWREGRTAKGAAG